MFTTGDPSSLSRNESEKLAESGSSAEESDNDDETENTQVLTLLVVEHTL